MRHVVHPTAAFCRRVSRSVRRKLVIGLAQRFVSMDASQADTALEMVKK
jgi:hypothetical protein